MFYRVRLLASRPTLLLSHPGLGLAMVEIGVHINGYWHTVGENLTNCQGMTCDGQASCPGGVEILLAASSSCYRNRG